MENKAGWKHLMKGEECKLCGSVSGVKSGSGRRSAGCSYSAQNLNLFYCHRKKKLFFLDQQGRVVEEGKSKWGEVDCRLCGDVCLLLHENPRQRWCRTKGVTFFIRNDGTVVCRALDLV